VSVPAFQLPRTLFAAGALACLQEELADLGVWRALLVTDRGIEAAGLVARLLAAVPDRQPVATLADVTENPLFADVERGAVLYRRHSCDAVIALGGGSVIDTAKYIALLGTNIGSVADYAGNPAARPRRCAPLVVIPTTSGTGSEASPDAGIHPDAHTASTGMSSAAIVPHLVLLDPQLTVSLPARLTAATGIDAISHCIEGYLSRQTSPLTDAVALDGLRRAHGAIARAVRNGSDLAARYDMMSAAYAGGLAIGMGLGPAHAIAITCSDQGYHHGVLSGIGLVCTLDTVARNAAGRAAAIADALGASADGSLSRVIADLMRSLGLPATLAELGYRAADLEALGAAAHASPFNFSARVHPGAAEYRRLIEASLAGALPG
jgi:alcohol dehydrogenase class IV